MNEYPVSTNMPADMPPLSQPESPYHQIRDAIMNGSLAPGASLVEKALASWCGVSRTPIREALLRLEQDGLVERTSRGLVVRQRSPEEVLDIYEVRIVLEAAAARVAAERHTEFDRIRFERLLTACEALDETAEPGELARVNGQFHHGVRLASHSQPLIDLLGRLNLHLMRYPATTLAYPKRWERALVQHRELIEAIVQRDGTRAAELAEVHFTEARNIRLQLWESGSE